MKGLFISFEGVDGCGKSTQMRFLAEYLTGKGYDVVATREPGGCSVSEKIREILLSIENSGLTDRAEALLYAAARAQLVDEVIRPAVNEGKIVLCDRFIDSSLAYQGVGRNLGIEDIYRINEFGTGSMMPDKTFFLDFPPKAAFERMKSRCEHDRLETQGMEFFENLYGGFRKLADMYPDRIISIDVSGDKYSTHKIICAETDKILAENL